MRAELRGIEWYERGRLEDYDPDPSQPFEVQIIISVGADSGPGADLFTTTFCNALSLADRTSSGIAFFGYAHFIAAKFDYVQFESEVRAFCAKCEADTWREIALMVSKIGDWEYAGLSE